jgi:hypothetical protein
MSDTKLYNTDLTFWQNTAKAYRERPHGGTYAAVPQPEYCI